MQMYRRFKKKYRIIHILIVAAAIVMLWRSFWGLLDLYLLPDSPILSYVVGIIVAFSILYFDDFHLKELE